MGRRCNNESSPCEPPDKKLALSLPEGNIKEGTLLTDILGNQWRLGKAIGTGGFGDIYLASSEFDSSESPFVAKVEDHSSGPLFVEIHCYLRIAKLDSINKWKEEMQMQHLAIPHYVASGSHTVGENKYRFLILPRYDKDLESIFAAKRKFNLKTTLTIGLQIIDALEYIHSNGYVHSDIKASNILFNEYKTKKPIANATPTVAKTSYRYRGFRPVRLCKVRKIQRTLRTNYNLHSLESAASDKNQNMNKIYLLDYGLASRYVDSNGEHKAFDADNRKAHVGTILFCSRDAHVGVQSRRSDLECLGYNLIYWLTSDLPWVKYLADPEMVHKKKTRCIQNVRAFLEYCFNGQFPRFLYHYFVYLHNLEFEAKPDYKYIKTLFKKALREYGYIDNLLLDFDNLEGWGRKQKKTKCNSENVRITRAVQSLTRTPLKSNLPTKPNLRKEKKLKVDKDWAQALINPEEIIKEAKIRKRKMTDSSDSNQSNGIQNLDLNALNPTSAMLEVFFRSLDRINNGTYTLQHRANTFVDHIEGYTPPCSRSTTINWNEKNTKEEVKFLRKQRLQRKRVEVPVKLDEPLHNLKLKKKTVSKPNPSYREGFIA
ncbi:hypothetical protein FQR65_LT01299 [Abscondita terminalis]|nr:hypothetical protein FQR65_LT01299 [Abscondita terminalis]